MDEDFLSKLTLREKIALKYTFICKECGKSKTQSYNSYLKSDGICKGCMIKKNNNYDHSEVLKQAMLKKYGVENPSQLKSVVDKRKQTSLEKYGVENPAQYNAIKEKIKQTNIEKYGVSCSLHDKEISKKVEQTMISKYGTKCSLSSKAVQDKRATTMKERYGVEHPSQAVDIAQRMTNSRRKTQEEKFRYRCIKLLENKTDNFNEVKPLLFQWECPVCKQKQLWTPYKWIDESNFRPNLFCINCWKPSRSSYENMLLSMIPENIKVVANDREVIHPKELDLYFPEHNLAIEFDGEYWHQNSTSSLEKKKLCEEKNIRLINIFQHEFNEDKIKSALLSALNIQPLKKIYARKCVIKNLSTQEYIDFCNTNHLQNAANASVKLGLFYEDELVEVMSFSQPRFTKKYQWEIIRECSKNQYAVIGGKEKLFNHFLKTYDPSSIISYCDQRWFDGGSYLRLGFKLDHISKPSYFYYKKGDVLQRYQCQKHMLSSFLERYDPELTESDNMNLNGFMKLFDFGEKVFVWKK